MRSAIVTFAFFLPFLILFFFADVRCQISRSTISGHVFDQQRRPVSQIYVELHSEFSTIARVKTDGSGRYYFAGLGHGRYTVKALPYGTDLMEHSEDVEIAGIGVRGQQVADNVQRDIYLKPRRGDSVPFKNEIIYAQNVPKEAADHYVRAVEDLKSQRTESGIDELEKAIAIFPEYFMALQRLALVRLSQQRFADATSIFSKAISVNERCFDCWFGLAYSSYSIRKFPESVTAAEKAVTLKQDSIEANLLLGMSFRSIKDFTKAEKVMLRAAKLSGGTNADVHWHLALLYGKDLNRYADAARELEAYLKASPDVANAADVRKLIEDFKRKGGNK